MYRYQVSSSCSTIAQGVIGRESGTHQRSTFHQVESLGHASKSLLWSHHIFRIAPVITNSCNFAFLAIDKISYATKFTLETMAAMPANPDPITTVPLIHFSSHFIDITRYFMPRNSRVSNSWPQPIFDKDIAMANSACLDFDSNLACSWLRNRAFHKFERAFCTGDLNRFHCCHDCSSFNRNIFAR